MKYVRKTAIEAIQFIDTPERIGEIAKFVGGNLRINYKDKDNPFILIDNVIKVNIGDYIIKDAKGECYPCKQNIFEDTYKCVDTSLDDLLG